MGLARVYVECLTTGYGFIIRVQSLCQLIVKQSVTTLTFAMFRTSISLYTKAILMKPSIDEVLQKLMELHRHNHTTNSWIYIEHLAEEMHTHYDNIVPSLLMLEREDYIHFSSKQRLAVALQRKGMAA